MLTFWSKFLLIFAFKVFLAVRNYKVQCTYAKESAVISSAIYHTAKWVVRVPGLARLAFSDCLWRGGRGFFPVRDIILRHYHHRHHHRDGSHLDILWLSLTHYPTYAHWRHSVSQSVCHCWSLRFLWLHAGFPSRRSFLNSARLERVSCGVLLVFTQREIPFRCIEVFSVYNLKYPWVY